MTTEGRLLAMAGDDLANRSSNLAEQADRARLAADIEDVRKKAAAEAWVLLSTLIPDGPQHYPRFTTPTVIIGSGRNEQFGEYSLGVGLSFIPNKLREKDIPDKERFSGILYLAIPTEPTTFEGLDIVTVHEGGKIVEKMGTVFHVEELRPERTLPTKSELTRVKHMRQIVDKVRRTISPRGTRRN